MDHKKRDRKRNFSREEKIALIEFVAGHKADLFGKAGFCGLRVEERKKRAWNACVVALKAAGGPEREWMEARKKWQEMKTKALGYRADEKMTGGGPAPLRDETLERVLEVLAPEVTEGILGSQEETSLEEQLSESILNVLGTGMFHHTSSSTSSTISIPVTPALPAPPTHPAVPATTSTFPVTPALPAPPTLPAAPTNEDRKIALLESINATLNEMLAFMKSKEE